MAKFVERKFVQLPIISESKRRATATIEVNTVGIPKDAEIIAGYIQENTRKLEEEQKKKEKDPNKKKKIIAIGLLLLSGFLGMQAIEDTEVSVEHVRTPFSGMYYMVEDASQDAWGMVNAVGQEEMTNIRELSREKAKAKGASYSSDIQADREYRSIEGHEEYLELKATINANMAVLKNPDATQEELKDALTALRDASKRMKEITESKRGVIEEASKGFEESSSIIPDSRTDREVDVKNRMVQDFEMEVGLSEENIKVIEDILRRAENGEEIRFDMVAQAMDEDYLITGESSRDVVHETKLRGIRAILSRLSKAFSKTNENPEQNQDVLEQKTQDDSEQR